MAGVGYYGSSTTEGTVPWLQMCQRRNLREKTGSRVLDAGCGHEAWWFPRPVLLEMVYSF